MNYYKSLRLDELGITSLEEAEEMELELDVRFREFTPDDRMTWLRQNAYLEHYARTRTVTTSARKASVSVFAAKAWKRNDTLGFTRRLEISELEFSDRLEELALERASDPKAPASLLIELLRAYIPEKFSRNGHKCDTSKSDEILHRLREDAQRGKSRWLPRPPRHGPAKLRLDFPFRSRPRRGRDTERGFLPRIPIRRRRGSHSRQTFAHTSYRRRNVTPYSYTGPVSRNGPHERTESLPGYFVVT